MMTVEQKWLVNWALSIFGAGCLLGDIARDAIETGELDEQDETNLTCAREGYLVAR